MMFIIVFHVPNNISAQIGLKKNHILSAYNTIKLTANYPKTWSLSDYAVYSGNRDRKCIDLAIIEINAKNVFGVPINSSFICYFIRGRMFWYSEQPFEPSFVKLINQEKADRLIELAVDASLNIEKTISREELCKSAKEEEEEMLRRKQEQQRQERLAEEKRQQELLKQKRQEIIAAIESKIPNQILEASELFLKNKSTLMPLNETAQKTLDKLEKGLIDHFANDTLKIALKPHSFEKYYISTLTAGSHVFRGNYNDFNDPNPSFPFTIDYLAEIRKATKVKDICCDAYRPFRIDFMVEVRDSILIETNYYSSNTKKPVFLKDNLEFYYKASSNLTTLELEYNAAIPKGWIEVVKTYKYEKRLNDFIESESEYKVSYRKVILKKEK